MAFKKACRSFLHPIASRSPDGPTGPSITAIWATIDGTSYVVDAAGIRTSKTDHPTEITSNYGYDRIYQLLNVEQGASATEDYTYDPVGNMLSSQNLGSHVYNQMNQLTATSAGSYSYDDNGNMLTDPEGRSYTWDYENRLIQVTMPATGAVTFKYDPMGRRIQKVSASGTTNFVYDGSSIVAEYDENGTVIAKYAHGPGIDEPLAQFRSNFATYYHADGLGSVTSLTDSMGLVVNTYAYDSFGKTTASTGTLANPYRYTAREFDSETGLYYHRARYYDPAARRFISEDPIGLNGGINQYAYAFNNPIKYTDPSGNGVKKWYPPIVSGANSVPDIDAIQLAGITNLPDLGEVLTAKGIYLALNTKVEFDAGDNPSDYRALREAFIINPGFNRGLREESIESPSYAKPGSNKRCQTKNIGNFQYQFDSPGPYYSDGSDFTRLDIPAGTFTALFRIQMQKINGPRDPFVYYYGIQFQYSSGKITPGTISAGPIPASLYKQYTGHQ